MTRTLQTYTFHIRRATKKIIKYQTHKTEPEPRESSRSRPWRSSPRSQRQGTRPRSSFARSVAIWKKARMRYRGVWFKQCRTQLVAKDRITEEERCRGSTVVVYSAPVHARYVRSDVGCVPVHYVNVVVCARVLCTVRRWLREASIPEERVETFKKTS